MVIIRIIIIIIITGIIDIRYNNYIKMGDKNGNTNKWSTGC